MADGFFDLNTPSSVAESMLLDVADCIQLTPTDYAIANQNYRALANLVDGPNSPLQGRVVSVHPSGSFSIGAAILGKIQAHKHDVDAVVELDIPANSDPEWVLMSMLKAIRGAPGSRYHEKTSRKPNSRCVTVTYDDGRTVDLMPVVRLQHPNFHVCTLFHWKPEAGEKYFKEVNPRGFSDYFKRNVRRSAVFERAYDSRSTLLEKAATEPFPGYDALPRKAPGVVALQLIKRARDRAYRPSQTTFKRPPSVVLAALSLDATGLNDTLLGELLRIARSIRSSIGRFHASGMLAEVRNPAWYPDVFTDRWPESMDGQAYFLKVLDRLIAGVERLGSEDLDFSTRHKILSDLFGETPAEVATDLLSKRYESARAAGRTSVSRLGTVSVTAAGVAPLTKRPPFGEDR